VRERKRTESVFKNREKGRRANPSEKISHGSREEEVDPTAIPNDSASRPRYKIRSKQPRASGEEPNKEKARLQGRGQSRPQNLGHTSCVLNLACGGESCIRNEESRRGADVLQINNRAGMKSGWICKVLDRKKKETPISHKCKKEASETDDRRRIGL